MADKINISDELLAAYAEGNVSHDERIAVRQYLMANPDELESVMMMMDEDYDLVPDETLDRASYSDNFDLRLDALFDELSSNGDCCSSHKILPATSMAAQDIIDNQCAVRCEGIALRRLGINITDEELLAESKKNGWLQPEGTALHNIGRLSGMHGMGVSHCYGCKLDDVCAELQAGHVVLAAVDGGELVGNLELERIEDSDVGEIPDHVVVIESVDSNTVIIYDPSSQREYDTYSIAQFLDAWADSSYYLIIIYKGKDYEPHPIDLSDVEISDDLIELREAIAENAHEVWAYNRKQEGWKYGPERDDEKKLHPDMIAYSQLPESEKLYDREMAINTIKLVKKLGWDIVKRK